MIVYVIQHLDVAYLDFFVDDFRALEHKFTIHHESEGHKKVQLPFQRVIEKKEKAAQNEKERESEGNCICREMPRRRCLSK